MTREPATLLILAGGEAKRMGFPKHELTIDGRGVLTILQEKLGPLFVETIVVGSGIAGLPTGVRNAEDHYVIRSALVGIHAGLSASQTHLAFIIACDMPHVVSSLVEHLLGRSEGADVVVPVVRGYYEPLCAVYRRRCIGPIERLIERGVLKVSELYGLVRLHVAGEEQVRQHDPQLQSFVNLNAPAEIETARQAGRLSFR
jgi:molybdopterin-guanine dinucleotide biosynthesis protein A